MGDLVTDIVREGLCVSREGRRVSDGALDVLFEALGVAGRYRFVCSEERHVTRRSPAVSNRERRRLCEGRGVGTGAW